MDEQKLYQYLDTKFMAIDTKFSIMQDDINTLKTDVGTLKTDVGTLKTDVGNLQDVQIRLESKIDRLAETQANDTYTLMKLTYGKIEEIQKELHQRDEFTSNLKMAVRAAFSK